jgi:phospholipid-translocating ATPase
VGRVVKVHEDEQFPADLVIINSSAPKGICYIETKNLDGETNLKHKQAVKELLPLAANDQEILRNFNNAVIECEPPNEFLYKF